MGPRGAGTAGFRARTHGQAQVRSGEGGRVVEGVASDEHICGAAHMDPFDQRFFPLRYPVGVVRWGQVEAAVSGLGRQPARTSCEGFRRRSRTHPPTPYCLRAGARRHQATIIKSIADMVPPMPT